MDKGEFVSQREGLLENLGQNLAQRVESFYPLMFEKEVDEDFVAFSGGVFEGLDLTSMITYERPRKPPVILQVYQKFVGAGFSVEQVVFVMGLLEAVLAEYVSTVSSDHERERSRAIYPLEEAMITEAILARVETTRDEVLVSKFSQLFGLSEDCIAKNFSRIKEGLEAGGGKTVSMVIRGVRAQVERYFSKKLLAQEETTEDIRESEIYGWIEEEGLVLLAKRFQPKSFNLKENRKNSKKEFSQDQIVWIYALFSVIPDPKLSAVKRALAKVFGCSLEKIGRLKTVFEKDKNSLSERMASGLASVNVALKKLRPEPKAEASPSLESLPREGLVELVYGKIADANLLKMVKIFEPAEGGFEKSRLGINSAQRRWILAVFVASESEDRTEQAKALARIFNCDKNGISVFLRPFGENGQARVNAQVWQDFVEMKSLLGDKEKVFERPVDIDTATWFAFVQRSKVLEGGRSRAASFGAEGGSMFDERLAHSELGVKSSDFHLGGVVSAEDDDPSRVSHKFTKLLGASTNGSFDDFEKACREVGPVTLLSLNLGAEMRDKAPEVRSFLADMSFPDKAALRLGFKGWSTKEIGEFFAGAGSMARLKANEPFSELGATWDAVRNDSMFGAKRPPLPFFMGLRPSDPDLFKGAKEIPMLKGTENSELFVKLRIGLGTLISLLEKEWIYLLTARLDREHAPSVQRFSRALEEKMDKLNELCLGDFFGARKVTSFNMYNQGEEGVGAMLAIGRPSSPGSVAERETADFMNKSAGELFVACSFGKLKARPRIIFTNAKGERLRPGDRAGVLRNDDRLVYSRSADDEKRLGLPFGAMSEALSSEPDATYQQFLKTFGG